MSDRLPVPDDADLCAALEWGIERQRPYASCIEHLFEGGTRSGQAGRATRRLKLLAARGLVKCPADRTWDLTPAGSALAQEGTLRCPGYWDQDDHIYTDCGAVATAEGRRGTLKCAEHAARELRAQAAEEAGHAEWAEGIAQQSRANEAQLLASAASAEGAQDA